MKYHKRRISWLGLIILLGCGLVYSASAQPTMQKVVPRPTPTPKVLVEKKTTTDPTAIHAMMVGSLTGTIYYYVRKGDLLTLAPCVGNETFINLIDSKGKNIARRVIHPGKKGDKNAVCHYEFRNIPAGTYTLNTSVDAVGLSGIQLLAVLDMHPYYIMQIAPHPEEVLCKDAESPCRLVDPTVTIVGRKASVLDLSVRIFERSDNPK